MPRKVTMIPEAAQQVPTEKQLLQVAAYCRVSTKHGEQQHSLAAPISYYTNYIQNHPNWVLVEVYSDTASGTNTNQRPSYRKLIRDCTKRKVNLILVKSLSRFGRNALETICQIRRLKEMGLPGNKNLSLVSDMYMSDPHFGISAIIKKLGRTFRLKTTGSYADVYQTICGIPWKRIYTTNYDNLCESTMQSMGIAAIPNTLSDNASDYFDQFTVVHLNGYIDRLTPETLQKEFKLSSESYLAEDFQGSSWLRLFTAELNAAQALILIGVSFDYDIDLQRIIVNSDVYKDKIIFVDRPLNVGEDPRMTNYYKYKFDTYQMDTQTARYYLESIMYSNNSGCAFSSFESAHKLLSQVIYRKQGQNHLVFKQVIKYRMFYETFSECFTNTQRNRMIRACREFIDICQSYLLTGQRSKTQMRITDEAIRNLSDLKQRLIRDIGEAMSQ